MCIRLATGHTGRYRLRATVRGHDEGGGGHGLAESPSFITPATRV